MKKYCFTGETMTLVEGTILRRIKALIDIPRYGIKVGDLGGWIEKEENLSHEGDAWVADGSMVYGDKNIHGRTLVIDNEDHEIYDDDELILWNHRSIPPKTPFKPYL